MLQRWSRVAWAAAVTPHGLGREPTDAGAALATATVTVLLVGFLVGTLTGFSSFRTVTGAILVVGVVALVFESTAVDRATRHAGGRLLLATVGPLIPGLMILLALITYLGPLGLWYALWILPDYRVAFLTVILTTLLWTAAVMVMMRVGDSWHARLGGMLAAAGAALVTLTALLPDWVDVLRHLDRPLNIAPATETMLFALRTYAGVSLAMGRMSWIVGTLLLAIGYGLWWRSAGSRRRLAVGKGGVVGRV